MRVTINKKTKNKIFNYTGSLQKEIESCEREIAKKTKELEIWVPVYEKMKHEVDYRRNRIKDCQDFIKLAKEKLKEDSQSTNKEEI